VVGVVAKKLTVLLAVAALPKVVVKFPLAGKKESVPGVPDTPRVGVKVRAGVAPAIISPAEPAKSSVVAAEVPPMFKVLFGEVIVSPPPPPLLPRLALPACPGLNVATTVPEE
jgi:hypothetical protein